MYAIRSYYAIVMTDDLGNPISTIKPGDVVLCFNFRTDRLRQITTALSQQDFPEFGMKTIPLEYYTMTRYDENFKNINIVYENVGEYEQAIDIYKQVIDLHLSNHDRAVSWNSLGDVYRELQRETEARITSYNVCYTKLLRLRQFAASHADGPARH